MFLLLCYLREKLHTKSRQEETYKQLHAVLGESCVSLELQLADSEYEILQGTSSISPAVAEELFASEYSKKECPMQALSPDMTKLKETVVNVDNSLSPSHTLLQIHCVDHKGLLYDIMRTLKDHDIQVMPLYLLFPCINSTLCSLCLHNLLIFFLMLCYGLCSHFLVRFDKGLSGLMYALESTSL